MALHVKIATLLGLAATLALPARIVVAKPIDIGVAAPLSGPDAIFGNQIRIGVEQAVEDANASAGFSVRRAGSSKATIPTSQNEASTWPGASSRPRSE